MAKRKRFGRAATSALLLPLGLIPLGAHALGLGAMRVSSALGQPLAARIDIVGATTAEAELAKISLASNEVHQRMGVDSTLGGVMLRFAVKIGSDGRSYVSVSSVEPVREPYLDFVVEAVSPSGQVARHYTVLLDPVGSQRPPAAPPAWSPLVTPIPEVVRPSPRPRRDPFANVGLPVAGSTYGPVPPGTTLWAIARRVQPSGADLDTVMASIVRANPHAFINGDPARLKAAVKLNIPDAKGLHEVAAVTASAPTAEAPAPLKPAIATTPAPQAAPQSAAPAESQAAPSAEAQVRVLRGEDGTQAATPAAAPAGGSDRVQLLEESLDAAQQQNEALQQRLGSLEEQIKTLTALVKAGPAEPSDTSTAASGGPTTTVAPAPDAPAAVTSAATPTPKPAPPPASPVAEEQGLPKYLWAALAGLGLGGLVLWSRRRRAAAAPRTFDDDVATAVTLRSPTVAAAPVSTEVEWVEATPAAPIISPPAVEAVADGFGDPVDTQIDLLTAYVGMADGPSARQVYDEIQRSGTPAQKAQATALLARLDA